MKIEILTAMIVIALVFGTGQAKAPAAEHDRHQAMLVAFLHHPMDGRVSVKNIGTGVAGPSKLTLDCQLDVRLSQGGCPDLPPWAAPLYFDRAFPKNATVKVPSLGPGETFTHTLSFWNALKWTSGTYYFTVLADAEHTVVQRNRVHNKAVSTITVP